LLGLPAQLHGPQLISDRSRVMQALFDWFHATTRALLLLLPLLAPAVSAQGGPPLLTNDPGTPGNGIPMRFKRHSSTSTTV
jgi:hypothetical protein